MSSSESLASVISSDSEVLDSSIVSSSESLASVISSDSEVLDSSIVSSREVLYSAMEVLVSATSSIKFPIKCGISNLSSSSFCGTSSTVGSFVEISELFDSERNSSPLSMISELFDSEITSLSSVDVCSFSPSSGLVFWFGLPGGALLSFLQGQLPSSLLSSSFLLGVSKFFWLCAGEFSFLKFSCFSFHLAKSLAEIP